MPVDAELLHTLGGLARKKPLRKKISDFMARV
jgi:hypothetical protein